jgi:hypothetical protein
MDKLKSLSYETSVNMEISGAFMTRIQQLLFYMINQIGQPVFLEAYQRLIKGETPKNEVEEHLLTLLTMIVDFEKSAEDQGKIELKEIPSEHLIPGNPPAQS